MRIHAPLPAAFAVLLAAGLVSGCGKSAETLSPAATTPESQNETAVTGVMAMVPELAEDDLFLSEEETELGVAANAALGERNASPAAAIRPWRYWRHITDVDRRFEFEFSHPDSNGDPTRALVTIHKGLTGTFNILTPTPAPDDSAKDDGAIVASSGDDHPTDRQDLRLVRKRLRDHWVRRVLLVRIDPPKSDRHIWRIAATSGVSVQSVSPAASVLPPTDIVSLRIQKSDRDTTLKSPLELTRLRQIMRAFPGEEVKLTVTTRAKDDVVVLLHRGMRFRFHNNGDGTHSGRWIVPRVTGIHHFGVNALSRGTLFDDELPYCSDAWILPYVTAPIMVDELP
jgi:hypothetical protein